MEKLPCVTLHRHASERARQKHPWIFSNELADPKRFARLEPGSLVDVLDCHGDYLGTGFVNPKSLICVRILTRKREETIDEGFFRHRIIAALRMRDRLYGEHTSSRGTYRAVFGEADGLPGLIVDKFQGAWVVEPHALGMHIRKEMIAEALLKISRERGEENPFLVYRSDNRAAKLEGIEEGQELFGAAPASGIWAIESDIRFPVDPISGQKTGFFFDQRDNRSFFESYFSHGETTCVADVFCHSGAWGLRALKAGAKKVLFVDSSASALEGVRAVLEEQGWQSRGECIQADASEWLSQEKAKSIHALAIDPPALIPNKKSVPAGVKEYKNLNRHAFRLTVAGGLLSSSSCSYHLLEDKFEETLHRALIESDREGKILHRGGHSSDHPWLPGVAEGRYLKNFFFQVQ